MLLAYLIELRQRALKTLLFFGCLFLLCFYYANPLFQLLIAPVLVNLSQKQLLATQITAPIFAPLKLAANVSLLLTAPFAIWQFWGFISPALYARERKALGIALIFSPFLFLSGLLFCFFIVLPFLFMFFSAAVPQGVNYIPDITSTLDFMTRMLLIFGLCFQLPLFIFISIRLQWINLSTLSQTRPYFIVLAFIIGMLLTPPDVLSQILLALPLCALYELGILWAKLSSS